MISQPKTHSLAVALGFTASLFLLASPAAGNNYQVTVDLVGVTSIPAPTSYTFDTTNPFSSISTDVTAAITSVTWDAACASNCSIDSVSYDKNGSTISFDQSGTWLGITLGCMDVVDEGYCIVPAMLGKPINITTVGTYKTGDGSITVTDISKSSSSVPELTSYLELAGVGVGLALLGFRRFSPKPRT